VFIVGCYNSGTTLLADLMATHPHISALPVEGVQLSDVWPLPETYAWNRMWFKCLDEMHIDPDAPEAASIALRLKKQWSLSFADRPLLLEKSIANVPRMLFLQKHFQPAYFIYIVRNGYAVSEGLRRGAKPRKYGREDYGDQYPIDMCAQQWAWTDKVIEQDRPHLQHLHQISYESFTAKPDEVMAGVTDFLEIPSFSEESLTRTWQIHGVHSRIANMNAEAIARLSDSDIAAVASAVGETLSKFGHST
jgi:hypothetical protein